MVRISVSNRGSRAASLKLEYRIGSPGAYTCRKVSVWSLLSADFFLPPTKPKAESTRLPTPALDAIDRAPPPPPPPAVESVELSSLAADDSTPPKPKPRALWFNSLSPAP